MLFYSSLLKIKPVELIPAKAKNHKTAKYTKIQVLGNNLLKVYMRKKKTQINLLSLQDYLGDRKWEQLSEEERDEICQKMLEALFPQSQDSKKN